MVNNNGDDSEIQLSRKRKLNLEYKPINEEEEKEEEQEQEEVETNGGRERIFVNLEPQIQSIHKEGVDLNDLLELKLSTLPSESKSKSRAIRQQPDQQQQQHPPISLSLSSSLLSSSSSQLLSPSPSLPLSPSPYLSLSQSASPFQLPWVQHPQQFPMILHQQFSSPVSHPLPENMNININTNIPNPIQPPPLEQTPRPVGLGPPVIPMARHHFDVPPVRQTRARRNPSQAPREGKSETIPPPYPWSTNLRATVHSLEYLTDVLKITTIKGEVHCKKCERQYEIEFNLAEKFNDVANYIARNRYSMHERAPDDWSSPNLQKCRHCNTEKNLKPVIAEKKKNINWLFLLLGQMLGCLTLEQLKYFCKHTKNHRTGAKDRVLYLTYLGICKQLDPEGPFDR